MMKRCLILYFAILICTACGGNRHIRKTLDDVETYIESRPDSALAVLRGIDNEELLDRKTHAHYSLLFTMALDKNDIAVTDPSVIQSAVNWYSNHGSAINKAHSLYYYGVIEQNAKDYASAIIHYSEALRMLENVDDLIFKGKLYSALASVYYATHDYEESLKYQLQSSEIYDSIGNESQKHLALYNLAKAYIYTSRPHVADSLLSVLIESERVSGALRFKAKCTQAYSLAFSAQDAVRAYDLFRSVLNENGRLNTISDYAAFAYLLALNGKYQEANDIISRLDDTDKIRILYWKNRINILEGDYESAYNDLNKSLSSRDSIINSSLAQSATKAQRDYFQQMHEKENLKRHNLMLVLICASLIAVIALLAFFIMSSRRNKERQRLVDMSELVKNELRKTRLDLAESRQTAKKMAEDFETERERLRTEYFVRNQKLFAEIGDICDAVIKARKSSSTLKYKNLYNAVRKKVNCISDGTLGQEQFEKSLNEGMDNIMQDFRNDFPGLSDLDYRCVSYFFAGFTTSTIELLLDYPSSGAIYTRRSRIRKIMEQSEKPNKNLYLELL